MSKMTTTTTTTPTTPIVPTVPTAPRASAKETTPAKSLSPYHGLFLI
jgi:hypothetical protein